MSNKPDYLYYVKEIGDRLRDEQLLKLNQYIGHRMDTPVKGTDEDSLLFEVAKLQHDIEAIERLAESLSE